MIDLYRSGDDARVGAVTEEELRFLIDHLEEESGEDTDYYVDRDTLDFLAGQGASPGLIALLEAALGSRAGVEIYYSPAG